MMYLFGETQKQALSTDVLEQILIQAKYKKKALACTKIEDILTVLSQLSAQWKKGSSYYNKALEYLNSQPGFSPEMNEATLDILEELLSYDSLKSRVEADFNNTESLDRFRKVKGYKGSVKYLPLGILLHVTAGNVFLGCIDSLLMGLLTKNISLVKLSSSNDYLPFLFAQSLLDVDTDNVLSDKVCLLSWKGGSKEIEDYLKNRVDAIIAWGGQEMANSYAQGLNRHVRFIEHGPKISFQVLDKYTFNHSDHKDLCESIAKDVCLWDQSACANSQILYVEEGINLNLLKEKLSHAFDVFPYSRGELDSNQHVELLKEVQRSYYSEFLTQNASVEGDSYLLHIDASSEFRLSPLGRTLLIKTFKNSEDLSTQLTEYKSYLQTCGLGVEYSQRQSWMTSLALDGVNRFTSLGGMLESLTGSPHDGSFTLQELTRVHCDEYIPSAKEFALDIIKDIPFYKDDVKEFSDLPLIDGDTLANHSLVNDKAFKNTNIDSGIVFSSGGTSGNPKFCLYTNEEFKTIASYLAKSYQSLGLEKGSVVANLFMAGNMWSSFSAIQYALEHCDVTQLPMGGNVNAEDFKKYIENFKVDTLFGLPSLIIELANQCPDLSIKNIFYAGEAFSEEKRAFIEKVWGCKNIHSAGYASVDVGPIGYQDESCEGSEHILFDELVYLEVVNGEGVVTSRAREAMPVIRYKTGDRIEILSSEDEKTRFKLIGRVDSLINIWGCRFALSEIDDVLKSFGVDDSSFQVIIENKSEDLVNFDTLELRASADLVLDKVKLTSALYEKCEDIRKTISLQEFESKFILSSCSLLKNIKTGKFKKLNDLRKI